MSVEDEIKIREQRGITEEDYRIWEFVLDVKAATGSVASRKARLWARRNFGLFLSRPEVVLKGADEDKQATFSDLFPNTTIREVYKVEVKFITEE